MSEDLIGNYLGPIGTEYLIEQLLLKIRNNGGFNISTHSISASKRVQAPASELQNWTAHGTMFTVPRALYLDERTKFSTLIPDNFPTEENQKFIFSIYRYTGLDEVTELPTGTLVCSSDSLYIDEPGWKELSIDTICESKLTTDSVYFFVYLYNIASIGMLGCLGTSGTATPWVSFVTSNLGDISAAPSTLTMQTESPIRLYGNIYRRENT